MKKLIVVLVLAGGWYVYSNDLLPDAGLLAEAVHTLDVARRAGRPASDDPDLDRIERMEADLTAQSRYLDQRGSELQALKQRVAPPSAPVTARSMPSMRSDFDAYNREVADINADLERYRRYFATYREELDHYNARARRSGMPMHRAIAERGDYGIYRPVHAAFSAR